MSSSLPPPTRLGARLAQLSTLPPSLTVEPELIPWRYHPESGKAPCLELVRTLLVVLPAVPVVDGECITEAYLSVPAGTRIAYDSPRWAWRSDLVWAHYSMIDRRRALEFSLRVLELDT